MSRLTVSILMTVLLLAGCGGEPSDSQGQPRSGKLVVMTTMYPMAYLAERIGGDLVEVICPVPAGEDPIFWQPDEETIGRYQEADLIVLNGADFAKWVAKTPLPSAKIVDTAKPFEKEFIRFETATTHAHGPAGEHAHEGIDGHTWMDPVNAKIQADEIREALVRLLPEHEAQIDARFKMLARDLDELDRGLTACSTDRALLASHPAYNYIAKRYGWNVVNLDLDPAEMPSAEVFGQISKILEDHPAKFLLWESSPEPEIAAKLHDELMLACPVISPCELEGDEDYLAAMKRNLLTMKEIFEVPGD